MNFPILPALAVAAPVGADQGVEGVQELLLKRPVQACISTVAEFRKVDLNSCSF